MLCLHLRCKGSTTSGRAAAGLGEFTALQQGPDRRWSGAKADLPRSRTEGGSTKDRARAELQRFTLLPPLPVLCPVDTEIRGLLVFILLGRYRRSPHANRVREVQARAEVITVRRSLGHHSPVCGLVAATQERWKGYLVCGDGLGWQRRCNS
jgi:hypothetical protein